MQYNIGYILPNLVDVYIHTDGTLRRYEKVYERSIKLYKEVDNTFTLVVRNQDQKAQFVDGTTTTLQISDSDNNLKVTKVATILDLSVGDTVSIYVYHNEGGARDTKGGAESAKFMGYRIIGA